MIHQRSLGCWHPDTHCSAPPPSEAQPAYLASQSIPADGAWNIQPGVETRLVQHTHPAFAGTHNAYYYCSLEHETFSQIQKVWLFVPTRNSMYGQRLPIVTNAKDYHSKHARRLHACYATGPWRCDATFIISITGLTGFS